MLNSLLRISILSLAFLISACGEEKNTIDAPIDETVSTSKPSLFKVTFGNGIPADFQLVLNATDVTDQFTLTPADGDTLATAEADGALLAGNVFSGKNQFSLTVPPAGVISSIFYFDDIGPSVHILHGDHDTGIISGHVNDSSGVASLSIDGVDVPLDANNNFDTTFTGMAFNEISATDINGKSSSSTYARGDQELFPSMSMRINNGGFDFLTTQAENALENFDFDALLLHRDQGGINPVLQVTILSTYDIIFNTFEFDRPIVSIQVNSDPEDPDNIHDEMVIHIEIPNFRAGMNTEGGFLDFEGLVTVDNLLIESNAVIGIDNSDISISISDTVVDLQGLDIDIDGFIIAAILEDMIPSLVPIFVDIAESTLVPLVSDFVGEVLVKTDIDINGEIMRVGISPTLLRTFSDGLTVDINSTVSAPFPSDEATPHLGSLFVESDLPSLGPISPNGSAYDIGASISVNLMNQALYAAHASGLTTFSLYAGDSGGTDPEGVSVIQSEEDDIQLSDIITLHVMPASPPFIKLIEANDIHGMLGWNDVSFEFELTRDGWDSPQTLFSLTFNLDVGFELGATDEGFLHIGIESLPDIDIVEVDNYGIIPISPLFIEKLIDYVMPIILPTLSTNLDSIMLPTIGGYRIHADELWVSGSGSTGFSIAGSMIEIGVSDASSTPSSLLALSTNTVEDVVSVDNAEADIEISELNNGTSEPLEYRYRLDGGGWSNWKQRDSIRMRRMMGGHHEVEICSRTVLMKQEVNCPVIEFNTTVNAP